MGGKGCNILEDCVDIFNLRIYNYCVRIES